VRSFADQVKHVATANAVVAASLLGEKSPYTVEDVGKGPAGVKTREQILALLKESFAAAHKAVATLEEGKLTEIVAGPFGKTPRMALATLMLSHTMDHYGQMVVYLRMNNVVPPASRPRN
jgi:hypothetical protein